MPAKLLLDYGDKLESPMEAILIDKWKNKERTKISTVIPESDNVYNSEKARAQFGWTKSEEFLYLNMNDLKLKSIVFIAQKDFPALTRCVTARRALEMAVKICIKEEWTVNRCSIESALQHLEMAYSGED